jgi:MarR family transcriptional regulator, organic hydroperoxide resistance regulator
LVSVNPLRLDSQLCFSLYAASRAMTAAYGPLLAPLGLTYPQYLVMLVLWENDGTSVKEIGERLQLDSGTLTPVLKKMEADAFVTRARDEKDARVVRITLTRAGKALERKAKELPKALLCQFGIDLPAVARLREELTALTQTLRAANAAAAQKE